MNFFWVFIEKFSITIIKILAMICLARLLSPSDYGIFAMAAVIISISSVVADAGMVGALIRKDNIDDVDLSIAFYLNLLFSILLYGLIYISSHEIEMFYNASGLSDVIKITSIVIVIRSISLVSSALLNRQEKFKVQAKIYAFSALSSNMIAVLIAYWGYGYWALVGQVISECVISSLLLVYKVKFKPSFVFNKEKIKYLLGFGVNLTISSLIQSFYESLPNILTGRNYSSVQLGYFSQANKLNFLYVSTTRAIIDKATYPNLSSSINDSKRFKEKSLVILKLFTALSFFLSTWLIVSATEVVDILLGEQWIKSVNYFSLLLVASSWMISESLSRTILKSLGLASVILKLEVFKRLIGIFILIILSSHSLEIMLWGYVGLSVASKVINDIVLIKYDIIQKSTLLNSNVIFVFYMLTCVLGITKLKEMIDFNEYFFLVFSFFVCSIPFLPYLFIKKKKMIEELGLLFR